MALPSAIPQVLMDAGTNRGRIRPTLIYNEGWMLRLILQCAEEGLLPHTFPDVPYWYSEPQLYTAFKQSRGKNLYETNTEADGVIGHFTLKRKCGLVLKTGATHFEVIEAKMFSGLSADVKNAPGYDQAARTVACMAHTLYVNKIEPQSLKSFGFYLVAPREQIENRVFSESMQPETIRQKISDRISAYSDDIRNDLRVWEVDWVEPVVQQLSLRCLSWEDLCDEVIESNQEIGCEVRDFYEQCLTHNRSSASSSNASQKKPRNRECLWEEDGTDIRIRVCNPGMKESQVHRSDRTGDLFHVPSGELVELPLAEQTPADADPRKGDICTFTDSDGATVTVEVIGCGRCMSRVKRVDGVGDSFKVANFKMRRSV